MTPSVPSMRDTRIDVIRALILLSIFINHVPHNPLEFLTHKNFGFSDAAEAFVLISGLSAGMAYSSKFQTGKALAATIKAWRRAGVLYVSQLCTTLFTLGSFGFFAALWTRPDLMEKIAIRPVMEHPAEAFAGIVLMTHQLGYNNILSIYVVMLLMLPPMMLLGKRNVGAMLGLSFAIWLVCGLLQIGPPNWPMEGIWFLDPLSWQFLFFIGVAAILHIRAGGSLPRHPALIGLAAGYLILSLLWVRIPLWGVDVSFGLPKVLTGFNKTFLSTFRLVHVLAAAYLIVAIAPLSQLFRRPLANPLAIMGRHALPVFIAGTLLAMVLQPLRMVVEPAPVLDALLVIAGCALLFALVYWLEFLGRLKRRATAPALQKERSGNGSMVARMDKPRIPEKIA
ncbi:OpgC family protein [Notoacmeibacter sp. MSK16QG-6]|uniref:OpgC family protein n=1 Tax=Notoacmeibacter sp. MSK16QG-6 TaxID=2957982 RepID=UPI0020A10A20|nr:OpgC domain-containing protein [Notoacmeibacter sp. MSK16QG-6]MCP1199280.1 OpgC domain-containing protein [Notoacmeibacter sp. MSK16QG-6]